MSTTRLSSAMNALTLGFLLALVLTAGVAGTAHLLFGQVIAAQSANARVVNVSGRQRMLSQRIALLATRWADQREPSDRQRLQDAIETFEQSHDDLKTGRIDELPHVVPASVQRIYFEKPYILDQQVGAYVADARRVLENGPDAPAAAERLSEAARPSPFHASALLGGLNQVVAAFQQEHDRQIRRLEDLQTTALIVLTLAAAVGATLVFFPLSHRVRKLARSLDSDAQTDALTGIPNRRGFELQANVLTAQRGGGAVLVLDIDNFKRINDEHGHAAGDAAMRHLSQVTTALLRDGDVFGRLGGDEFAAVLPGIRPPDATAFAERLRAAMAASACSIEHLNRHADQVLLTVSIGVRTFDEPTGLDVLMRDADEALYLAKKDGRNTVRVVANGTTVPFRSRGA